MPTPDQHHKLLKNNSNSINVLRLDGLLYCTKISSPLKYNSILDKIILLKKTQKNIRLHYIKIVYSIFRNFTMAPTEPCGGLSPILPDNIQEIENEQIERWVYSI